VASVKWFAIAKAIRGGAAIAEKRLRAVPSQPRCRKEEEEAVGRKRGGGELAIRRKERGRLESGIDWEIVKFPQTPFFRRSSP